MIVSVRSQCVIKQVRIISDFLDELFIFHIAHRYKLRKPEHFKTTWHRLPVLFDTYLCMARRSRKTNRFRFQRGARCSAHGYARRAPNSARRAPIFARRAPISARRAPISARRAPISAPNADLRAPSADLRAPSTDLRACRAPISARRATRAVESRRKCFYSALLLVARQGLDNHLE